MQSVNIVIILYFIHSLFYRGLRDVVGRLALKLLEKKGSSQFKSSIICFVYHTILWAAEPLPLIAEAHLLGHRAGLQAGDITYSCYNMILAIVTNYAAGQSLDTVQESILNFLSMLKSHGMKMFIKFPLLLLAQIVTLLVDGAPTEDKIWVIGTSIWQFNAPIKGFPFPLRE